MMLTALLLLAVAGAVLSIAGRGAPLRQAPPPGRRLRRTWRRSRTSAGSEVAAVLVEVAARLRAGAPVAEAWARSLPNPPPSWAAPVLDVVGVSSTASAAGSHPARGPTRAWSPPARTRRRDEPPPASPDPRVSGMIAARRRRRWPWPRTEAPGSDVAAAVAACRLATRTGAPLAAVVDVVVAGIAEVAEAQALRRTALAGPRATARLLAWLPAGGIALGTMLGADPVAVLMGGGVGGLCLVGGGVLFLVGRRWVHALVAQAERAGR